jgi:3-methylcrotonyl-CoA carboxylase beta subunit
VLPSIISTVSPEFKAKAAAMDILVKDIEEKMSVTRQGGGAKPVERMRSKGKLLPRERFAIPFEIP